MLKKPLFYYIRVKIIPFILMCKGSIQKFLTYALGQSD